MILKQGTCSGHTRKPLFRLSLKRRFSFICIYRISILLTSFRKNCCGNVERDAKIMQNHATSQQHTESRNLSTTCRIMQPLHIMQNHASSSQHAEARNLFTTCRITQALHNMQNHATSPQHVKSRNLCTIHV